MDSVKSVLDVTERNRLDYRFRQDRLHLPSVVASSPAMLYPRVHGGTYLRPTRVSNSVHDMTGYPAEDVFLSDWWRQSVYREMMSRELGDLENRRLSQGHFARDQRIGSCDGHYRWIRAEMKLQRDAECNLLEAVGPCSEIAVDGRAEAKCRRARKMETVGRLAGGIVHDFNNLLTVINGYAELVLGALPPDDPTRELVSRIAAAGERAAGLTRQLLTFSREAILEPRVMDLRALVTDLSNMLRLMIGEDIQLAVVIAEDPGAVTADPGQIEQVIMNLVLNGRDAMPLGGCLTIELQNIELDKTYAFHHPEVRPGSYVLLAVTDTGCGMDRETMSRIFEPFFSNKGDKGTGLGMATVHGIVRQSGGHVTVDSTVGIGTTFKLYLPRSDQPVPLVRSGTGPVRIPRGGETVLLVEDEDAVLTPGRCVLRDSGYTVLEAHDGTEAVRVAEQYPERIDLLVTDVVMPRMGSREAAERVARLHPGIQVLFVSGHTDDVLARHGILEGKVAFLRKPFRPSALAVKVREILDARD